MKQLILTLTFIGGCCILHSQVIAIEMGTHLVSDKILFGEAAINNLPRPFVFFGIGYIHPTGIKIALTYSPDIKIFSLSNTVPLWNLNKKRYKDTFSLINNRI